MTNQTEECEHHSLNALLNEIDPIDGIAAPAKTSMDRRNFLKVFGLAGAGFVLAFNMNGAGAKAGDTGTDAVQELNAYVRVSTDGTIHIYSKNPEIGQGIKTAMPMIIAEELDANWQDVKVEQSPINEALFGWQNAGGSRSIATNWIAMRQAGAAARHMLIKAAAKKWNVPASECTTENSSVLHKATNRRATYGDLASLAGSLPIPQTSDLKLKGRENFSLLGSRTAGVDNLAVVTGAPLFGIDQNVPGMLYAVYEKCPAIGGTVASANLDEIRALPGVKHAFVLAGNSNDLELMPGVAIVATSTWAAFQAKSQLMVTWDESNASNDSWTELQQRADALKNKPGDKILHQKGDVKTARDSAAKSVGSFYQYQFAAHANLEPQNCTAWYKGGTIELWAPTQSPIRGVRSVARVLGLDEDAVTLHQTRVGGGFGRRLVNDYACEAAAISRHIKAPVKLQWTREDDTQHDFYRAAGFHAFEGGLDADGKLSYWQNHLITFSQDGEKPVIAGAPRQPASEFPAQLVENFTLSQSLLPLRTRCGLLRAPGSNSRAWAIQSFLHEMAVAADRDHLEFLLEVMGEPRWLPPQNPYSLNTGRAAAVIKLAAEKAGWGKALPTGRGLGLAFHFSHAGHFAEVAEVSVDASNHITVHKVVVAADIGTVINLSGAENQCQGSVMDGLSVMAEQEITMEQGRIEQANFDAYPLLRMSSAPDVDVHFIESNYPPTGAGEPALPPLAPAVCNAIFDATGHRIRTLPLSKEGYSI
ncbi:MAG: xanthine dehydrogenase family protein molybdopterin-binding subunit [Kordiimonadaceae bacterium]|nr:xanthine dehydrogenase family protein molybdopterin-binding subunit [Kordiimonadaceae bacterium]MBO6567394.1 xanthine dehydrogenase family protein molybdopterin-binding subunit [Kordiimonadaceae bacterium]MBO6963392.1 xanthine dehydrogenase family protein molybdopterin-binding subunit [Kordiimonadaceae bacterium]